MSYRSITLAVAAFSLAAAGQATAQTASPATPDGQALSAGFFTGGSGGVGSPVNSSSNSASFNLFGAGGLWADAKPSGTATSTGNGAQPVNSSGGVNGSTSTGSTTSAPHVNLGGVGPGRFLVR